ncbi:MAG: hypothetical protein P3M74_00255 [Candidatus Hodgkinia cicadicola]|nr:MAG: hypothetical protein P3M74_00255 [Candidatus Hodgkinia cicadicola]
MKAKVENNNLETAIKLLAQRSKAEGITQQIRFKKQWTKLKPKAKPNLEPTTSLEALSWELQEVD